jgi:4-hydroxybenzoate polyprenyltransferase
MSEPLKPQNVLCVDLDGTLTRSDILLESVVFLVSRKPYLLFACVYWALFGRARLKNEVAHRVSVADLKLPLRDDLIALIERRKREGSYCVLATASHGKSAREFASLVPLFDEVIATTRHCNLKGSNKARELVERFGEGKFEYIGDSLADRAIFNVASQGWLVGPLTQRLQGARIAPAPGVSSTTTSTIRETLKLIRPYQWIKNILLFVPLFAAHQLAAAGALTPYMLFDLALGFISFSAAASFVYVLNDLVDIQADRHHAYKRHRPLACASVSLQVVPFLLIMLAVLAFGIGTALGKQYLLALTGYVVLTTLYTFLLKRMFLLDIIVLATLFTLRIITGGIISSIVVSPWLLTLAMFFFFALAAAKRIAELYEIRKRAEERVMSRGYSKDDFETIAQLALSSAACSALVMVLYVHDSSIQALYPSRQALLCMAPSVLYFLARIISFAKKGILREDPVLFALKDPSSYIIAGICFAALLVATLS